MLKLKIATASLALAGMMLIILGDTYMSATLAVVCTAVALPMGGYLVWRYLIPDDHSIAILLATTVPTSPTRDDGED